MIQIDLNFSGLADGTTQIQRLAGSMQSLAQAQRALASVPRLGGPGGGGGGFGGFPRGGRGPAGPLSNLLAARNAFQTALSSNNPDAIFDAQVRLRQAEARMARAQRQLNGPSFADRLLTFTRSTRFGGSGVFPLVGRTLDLFKIPAGAQVGLTAGIAAFVAAAAAATAGLRLFTAAAREGIQSLKESGDAALFSGGNAGNLASLQAIGLPAAQIAGLASGLQAALSSGGVPASFGAAFGLSPQVRGPNGSLNQAGLLQQAIQGISLLNSAEERLRAARALQLDAILPQIEALRRNRDAMHADALARDRIADAGTLQGAQDLFSALGRVKFNFQSLAQALGKPFLDDAIAALNTLASILRIMAEQLQRDGPIIREAVQPMFDLMEMMARLAEGFGVLRPGTVDAVKLAFEAERRRLAAQNQSVDQFGRHVQQFGAFVRDGTFGGGQRARSALPDKFTGRAFDQAGASAALRAGAFAV